MTRGEAILIVVLLALLALLTADGDISWARLLDNRWRTP